MTIEEMQKKLDELKDSIDNALAEVSKYEELIQQIKEKEEPKFERRNGEKYFAVSTNNGKAEYYDMRDNSSTDRLWYNNNNYFYTTERAQEVADKVNFLLRLERLHDTYCPDYVPDWYDYGKEKYFITYSYESNKYNWGTCRSIFSNFVFFPTDEIAEKVCKILNKERENNDKP